jgi:aminoglycoside phosphotransferase (APT) family kinase protein
VDMHPDQLAVPAEMVRELVDEQFPAWRSMAIRAVDSPGAVNAIFRVGERFAARFPLEPGDIGSMRRRLESEARAARELAGRTRHTRAGGPGRARRGLPASVVGADMATRRNGHG